METACQMKFTNMIDDLCPGWSTKVNSVFQVDGIPLWWFYSRFAAANVIPKQFKELIEKPSVVRGKVVSRAFRTFVKYNERKKVNVARKTSTQGKNVLFLTYTNHLKGDSIFRIQPIIDKIQEPLHPFVVFTDPLSARSYTQIRNLKHTVYGYVGKEERERAGREAKLLSTKWKECDKEIFGRQWKAVSPMLNFLFSQEFIDVTLQYYYATERMIREEGVQAIVLTSRNGLFEKCALAVAQKKNVPVIIVQHGLGLGVVDQEVFPGTKFAVFGEYYKDRLLKLGVPEEDVIVTGPLIFDTIVKYSRKPQNKIALLTAPFVEDTHISKEDYFMHVERIVQNLAQTGKEIVIKLHPREKQKEDYIQLVKKLGVTASIVDTVGEEYLYTLLASSELVVNFHSTVALEAMILDVPVLTIDFGLDLVPDVDNSPYMGGVNVRVDENIQEAVSQALEDAPEIQQRRKKTVETFCYMVDGQAAARVNAYIEKII